MIMQFKNKIFLGLFFYINCFQGAVEASRPANSYKFPIKPLASKKVVVPQEKAAQSSVLPGAQPSMPPGGIFYNSALNQSKSFSGGFSSSPISKQPVVSKLSLQKKASQSQYKFDDLFQPENQAESVPLPVQKGLNSSAQKRATNPKKSPSRKADDQDQSILESGGPDDYIDGELDILYEQAQAKKNQLAAQARKSQLEAQSRVAQLEAHAKKLQRPKAISIETEDSPSLEFIDDMDANNSTNGGVSRFEQAVGMQNMLSKQGWLGKRPIDDVSFVEPDLEKIKEKYLEHGKQNLFDAVIILKNDMKALEVQKKNEAESSPAHKNIVAMIKKSEQAQNAILRDIMESSLPQADQSIDIVIAKATQNISNIDTQLNNLADGKKIIAKEYKDIYTAIKINLLKIKQEAFPADDQQEITIEITGLERTIQENNKGLVKFFQDSVEKNKLNVVGKQREIENIAMKKAAQKKAQSSWGNSSLGRNRLKDAMDPELKTLYDNLGDDSEYKDLKETINKVFNNDVDSNNYSNLQKQLKNLDVIKQKSNNDQTPSDKKIIKLKIFVDELIHKNEGVANKFEELQGKVVLGNKFKNDNISAADIQEALDQLNHGKKDLAISKFNKKLSEKLKIPKEDFSEDDFRDLLVRLLDEETRMNEDTYMYKGLKGLHYVTVKPVGFAANYVGQSRPVQYAGERVAAMTTYIKNKLSGSPLEAQGVADMNKAVDQAVEVIQNPRSTIEDQQNALHSIVRAMNTTANGIIAIFTFIGAGMSTYFSDPNEVKIFINTLKNIQNNQYNQNLSAKEKKKYIKENLVGMLKDVASVKVAEKTGADIAAVQTGDLETIVASAAFNNAISYIDPSAGNNYTNLSDSMLNSNKVQEKHENRNQKKENKKSLDEGLFNVKNNEPLSNLNNLPNEKKSIDVSSSLGFSYEDYDY